ncbi:MAG: hypothetical protein ACI93R_000228 [Flavobacteriales bacterium]|jgi:uncharacterized protein YbgA (DUF1722 family)/uncharacterized protein YbbK (DUF523 family)
MIKPDVIATDKPEKSPIQVGLSACLAGQEVRYNGGHKQSRLCLDVLAEHFSFSTFCPEVAAGFGTPRPAMRLIGDPLAPRLTFSNDDTVDLSSKLIDGFRDKLAEFKDFDGYILMKNSPSCGLERVKVYQESGHPHETRSGGLFAMALQKRYPLMPIEEEGRLHDPKLFDNFVVRVYAYHNFRNEVLAEPSVHKLIEFHSRHKYLVMAHNQAQYRSLGHLLAAPKKVGVQELVETYFKNFMQALSKPASKENHTNALLHILGYLKHTVPSPARQNITETIHKYRLGIIPLTTPLTLLNHYLDQYGSDYIKSQSYLAPYPESMNPIRKYYQ